MADREFVLIGENTLEVAFVMEVNREMNEHNKLYGRFLPDQHNIGSITGLQDALDANSSAIVAEKERAEGVEGSLSNLATDSKTNLVSAINEVDSHADTNATNLSNHINDKSNPHEVTKAQVGLGNCDNTADIDKPISTATQTALDNITNGTTSIAYDNTTSGLNATTLQGAIDEIDSDLDNVEDLIPSAASSSNQLADKSYVDSADSGLQEQINMLNARGRFLALWNCATGLAQSNPPESPYIYKAGDYFIIGTVGTTNYKPTGSSYVTGQASTVVETESVDVNDVYYYDGANWTLQINTQKEVSFASVAGSPYDNTNLSNALNAKQNVIDSTHKLDSDLVDDTGQTNKFVTSAEKAQITTNANNITALQSGKADKSTTYTKTEVDTIASGKANVGLDNLNASGQMIIDSQNGTISNCILEIPQNIKLTLENNVLTLKSGSILTRTGSTYVTETTVNDLTYTFQSSLGNGRFVVLGNGNGLGTPRKINNVYSGNSSQYPTTGLTSTTVYFNTDDKLIYRPNDDFSSWNTWLVDYPLCVVDVVNSVASFAKDSKGRDLIFNGCGFIGHHFFGFPNVKCLIPNGIDDKGLLKSTFHRANAVVIFEMSSYSKYMTIPFGDRWVDYTEVDTYADFLAQYPTALVNTRFYVKELNKTFVYAGGSIGILEQGRLPIAKYTYDGTNVTQFDMRQPYEGARDLLTDSLQADVTTLTGYDSTQTQTLKNINGVLQWVTD